MIQILKFKKQSIDNLEIALTFIIFIYYLGLDISGQLTQAWALFGFVVVPILISRCWKHYFWVLTRNLPILIALIVIPASTLWSTTPDATLAYSRAFVCSTAFGIYLAARYTPQQYMKQLAWIFGISIFLNLLVPLLMPGYGTDGEVWKGITRHKNELSAAMALAGTFCFTHALYGNKKHRWLAWLGLVVAFFILLRTQGKGSLGIFVGLLTILPLNQIIKQQYKLRTCLIITALFITVVVGVTVTLNFEYIVVDLLGKDLGFNGREQLWNYLIDRGMQRPWLGYGYAGFWTDLDEGRAVAVSFPWIGGAGDGGGNAHSSYMDIFLQLGWLGLSLVAITLTITLAQITLLLGVTKQNEFFWMLQSSLFLAITSYYESYGGFFAFRHIFWVLYVSHSCYAAINFHRIFITRQKSLWKPENSLVM
ncbi:O-antigen polymerase [Calothrix sp. NIES-4101]|nr:O-antigen polymerase [Calothrix sp. NIES-4101]